MSTRRVSAEVEAQIEQRLRAGERPAAIAKDLGLYPGVVSRIRDKNEIEKVNVDPFGKLLRSGYKTGDLSFLRQIEPAFLNWLVNRHRRQNVISAMIVAELRKLYNEEMEWKTNPVTFMRSQAAPPNQPPLMFRSRRQRT